MSNKVLVALIVLILAVGGYFLLAKDNNNSNPNPTPPPPAVTPSPTPSEVPPPSPTPTPASGEVTIEYTSSGYSPSTVTIKKGTTVTFVNKTTGQMWPASAPHPTHTDYSTFDPKKAIAAGASWSFTFDQVGPWPFHDHLFPSRFGKITVTE